jgi:hypothetical protein
MKVVGFKRNATPSGVSAVAVVTDRGVVWLDGHRFCIGERGAPVSRRKLIQRVQAAPYGKFYYSNSEQDQVFDMTRLCAPAGSK